MICENCKTEMEPGTSHQWRDEGVCEVQDLDLPREWTPEVEDE